MSDDLARSLRVGIAGTTRGAVRVTAGAKGRCARPLACLPLLILLLLQGCVATLPLQRAAVVADSSATLIVVRRGWHIDVGFSTVQVQAPLDAISASFAGAQYLLFGFGDKHYLVAKHKSFPQMLGALWPGEAMMLVTSLAVAPEQAFGAQEAIRDEEVARIPISAAQARAAQAFIWESFFRQGGAPGIYADGPYPGSAFYLSAYRYSVFHTCNTWAAEVLQAAGLPVHTAGVMFAGQLWSQVRRVNAARHGLISAQTPHEAPLALLP
jgi:hypothetical protein